MRGRNRKQDPSSFLNPAKVFHFIKSPKHDSKESRREETGGKGKKKTNRERAKETKEKEVTIIKSVFEGWGKSQIRGCQQKFDLCHD